MPVEFNSSVQFLTDSQPRGATVLPHVVTPCTPAFAKWWLTTHVRLRTPPYPANLPRIPEDPPSPASTSTSLLVGLNPRARALPRLFNSSAKAKATPRSASSRCLGLSGASPSLSSSADRHSSGRRAKQTRRICEQAEPVAGLGHPQRAGPHGSFPRASMPQTAR